MQERGDPRSRASQADRRRPRIQGQHRRHRHALARRRRRKLFAALSAAGINIQMISTSEIKQRRDRREVHGARGACPAQGIRPGPGAGRALSASLAIRRVARLAVGRGRPVRIAADGAVTEWPKVLPCGMYGARPTSGFEPLRLADFAIDRAPQGAFFIGKSAKKSSISVPVCSIQSHHLVWVGKGYDNRSAMPRKAKELSPL